MEIFLIIALWFLNFGISWWNATAAGKAWVESKFAGGWIRFMVWNAAVMSACGFTWCILIFLAFSGHFIRPDLVTEEVTRVSIELGYIILIPFILVSGYAITFDSWARAWRDRSLSNMGVAGYNTFASAYNTYNAVQDFGKAFGDVSKFFTGNSSSKSSSSNSKNDGAAIMLVVLLVVLALSGGIILTSVIIRKNAATGELPRTATRRGREAYA